MFAISFALQYCIHLLPYQSFHPQLPQFQETFIFSLDASRIRFILYFDIIADDVLNDIFVKSCIFSKVRLTFKQPLKCF